MAKKKIGEQKIASLNSLYLFSITAQRLSIFLTVSATAFLWGTLLSIAHDVTVISSIKGAEIQDTNAWNFGVDNEITKLITFAVATAMVAFGFNLLLLAIPRVRKFRKHTVYDGLLLISFCFIISLWSQAILRFIIGKI